MSPIGMKRQLRARHPCLESSYNLHMETTNYKPNFNGDNIKQDVAISFGKNQDEKTTLANKCKHDGRW